MDDTVIDPKWSEIFSIIKKELRGENLTFSERFKARNKYAILVGPFYYFFRGMHKKGSVLFALYLLFVGVAGHIFEALNSNFSKYVPWIAIAVVVGHLAYRDYYKYKIQNESMWPALRLLDRNLIAFSLPVVIFFALVMSEYYSDPENNLINKHSSSISPAVPAIINKRPQSLCLDGADTAKASLARGYNFGDYLGYTNLEAGKVLFDVSNVTTESEIGEVAICNSIVKFNIEKFKQLEKSRIERVSSVKYKNKDEENIANVALVTKMAPPLLVFSVQNDGLPFKYKRWKTDEGKIFVGKLGDPAINYMCQNPSLWFGADQSQCSSGN